MCAGGPVDTLSQRKHALLLEEVQKINKDNTEKSGLKVQEATVSSGEPPQTSSTPADAPEGNVGKGLGEERPEEDGEKEEKEEKEEEDGQTAAKETEGKSDEDKPEVGQSGMNKADEEEACSSPATSPAVQDSLKDAVPVR